MYEYIKGRVVENTTSHAILEVNGVAYRILIPISYMGKLGEEQLLYTSFIVRELSHTLYGFFTMQERELFEIFISISGIGPKTALALIGHLDQEHLLQVVHNNDIVSLSKVPGIGKKTAERLLIELKGKLKLLLSLTPATRRFVSSSAEDALAALINLGYNQVRAEKAVQKARESLAEDAELSDIIALALKH